MPTLLVIDDEPEICDYVAKAMTRRSWTVTTADTVQDGISALQRRPVDIALCDVMMPDAGGPEFAQQLRRDGVDIPIVLMTAHPAMQLIPDEPFSQWWRPLPLLQKPFTLWELESVLNRVLRVKPDA